MTYEGRLRKLIHLKLHQHQLPTLVSGICGCRGSGIFWESMSDDGCGAESGTGSEISRGSGAIFQSVF